MIQLAPAGHSNRVVLFCKNGIVNVKLIEQLNIIKSIQNQDKFLIPTGM